MYFCAIMFLSEGRGGFLGAGVDGDEVVFLCCEGGVDEGGCYPACADCCEIDHSDELASFVIVEIL